MAYLLYNYWFTNTYFLYLCFETYNLEQIKKYLGMGFFIFKTDWRNGYTVHEKIYCLMYVEILDNENWGIFFRYRCWTGAGYFDFLRYYSY